MSFALGLQEQEIKIENIRTLGGRMHNADQKRNITPNIPIVLWTGGTTPAINESGSGTRS